MKYTLEEMTFANLVIQFAQSYQMDNVPPEVDAKMDPGALELWRKQDPIEQYIPSAIAMIERNADRVIPLLKKGG